MSAKGSPSKPATKAKPAPSTAAPRGLAALLKGKSPKEGYRDIVTHALAGFQLIEESLKRYIDVYYDAIRILIGDKLHFAFDRKDIEQAPLGKLCTIFTKISRNQDLVKRIRGLIRHRDEVAHRALTYLYGPGKSEAELQRMWDEYLEVSKEVTAVLADLHKELDLLAPIFKKGPSTGV